MDTLFEKLLKRIPGLQAVLVTDKDGVILAKAVVPELEECRNPSLASTFTVAAEQASRFDFGVVKSIVTMFENCVIFHISHTPLVITVIGEEGTNVGVLQNLTPELKKCTKNLRKRILMVDAAERKNIDG